MINNEVCLQGMDQKYSKVLKPPFWALHTDLLVQTAAQLSADDKKCSIETFLEELKNVEDWRRLNDKTKLEKLTRSPE